MEAAVSGLFYSIILRFIHDVIVTIVHSFFLLSITPLHGYPKICLSIHLLICFKVFGYCKQSCYEHSSISLCEDIHFFFFLFRAAPAAYGSSQARGWMGAIATATATATSTATATMDLSSIYNLHHSSCQHWILNLLREAQDGTRILMDTSRVCNLLSHNGNSWTYTFISSGK